MIRKPTSSLLVAPATVLVLAGCTRTIVRSVVAAPAATVPSQAAVLEVKACEALRAFYNHQPTSEQADADLNEAAKLDPRFLPLYDAYHGGDLRTAIDRIAAACATATDIDVRPGSPTATTTTGASAVPSSYEISEACSFWSALRDNVPFTRQLTSDETQTLQYVETDLQDAGASSAPGASAARQLAIAIERQDAASQRTAAQTVDATCNGVPLTWVP